MNLKELELKISKFVSISLENRNLDDDISFELPKKTIKKAYKLKFIDLRGYICVIRSREIRHVYNEHGNDVYFIKDIPVMLENFFKIERSNTKDRITKKTITSIVFTKRTSNSNIRIVKTNLSKNKILRLKTLFEE